MVVPDDERYGAEIRVAQRGNEVRLIFATRTREEAARLHRELRHQLRVGVLYLALTGAPLQEGER